MKKLVLLLTLGFVFMVGFSKASTYAADSTSVGMWYFTMYAKTPPIVTDWRTGFGSSSNNQFIGDISGDGKEDAVIFTSSTGTWAVGISNGNGFGASSTWITGFGTGSNNQFLADVNGDGKKDAIAFINSSGTWDVALSNGSGFSTSTQWKTGFGTSSSRQLFADVNGDGKEDAVTFISGTGVWTVALSNGSSFGTATQWISGFGIGSNNQFLADVNNDSKADAIYFVQSTGNWYKADSSGSAFGTSSSWASSFGASSQSQLVTNGNGNGFAVPFVFLNSDPNGDGISGDWYQRFYDKSSGALYWGDNIVNSGFGYNSTKIFQGNVTGNVDGWKASIAFYASTGTWKVEPFHFIKPNNNNTWTDWTIKYLPLTLGTYQTYDSGDTAVIDEHLATIAAANIDFLLVDSTNSLYVDEEYIYQRTKKAAARISNWNSNISNRNIKYSLVVGAVHYIDPLDPNHVNKEAESIEFEAGEVWNQFVNTPQGGTTNYKYLNGKPLLVFYLADKAAAQTDWEGWAGNKTNSNRFTIRWAHSPSIPGDYGWEVRTGTSAHDEAMLVMPGWNNNVGNTPVSRANGDYYSLSGWEQVMKKEAKPQIVIINSFNEFKEETAVAVSDTSVLVTPSEKWYDKTGVIDNSMYWNMTKNYVNLAHTPTYKASTLFSMGQGWYSWRYQQWNGSSYSDMTWDAANGRWKGAQALSLIMSGSQHPDTNDSVRTWVAPYAGTIRIQGTAKKIDNIGDGVIVSILKNSSGLWGQTTITNTTGLSHDVTTTVAAGDYIRFIVNKNGTNSNDTTLWDPTITYSTNVYSASNGFSATQANNSWTYQEWNGTSYVNMTWVNSNGSGYWQGASSTTLIGNNWQHADTNDSVRKWIAPTTGTVTITGNVAKGDISAGDGVRVMIKQNATQIWPAVAGWQTIAYNDSTGYNISKTISVTAGDAIYFIVNKNANNSYDKTNWNPIIKYQ